MSSGIGSIIGAGIGLLGKGGGGGGGSTSQPTIPEWLKSDWKDLVGRAKDTSNTPYQPFTGEAIAPLSADEQTSFSNLRALMGQATPYFQGAQGTLADVLGRAQNGPTAGDIQGLMNPYMQDVVETQKLHALHDYDNTMTNVRSGAAKSGAFGGDRRYLMEGQANRNINEMLDSIQANGLSNAWNNAQQQWNANTALMGSTALNQAQLATNAQGLGMQEASALGAAGATQRGVQQSQDTFNYNEFMRKIQDAQQKETFLSNILGQASPSFTGQSVQLQNPSASPLNSIIGGAMAGSQAFGQNGPFSGLFSNMFGSGSQSNNSDWLDSFSGFGSAGDRFSGSDWGTPYIDNSASGFGSFGNPGFGLKKGGLVKRYADGGLIDCYAMGGSILPPMIGGMPIQQGPQVRGNVKSRSLTGPLGAVRPGVPSTAPVSLAGGFTNLPPVGRYAGGGLFDILGSAWDDLTSDSTAPAQLPEPSSDTGISTPQAAIGGTRGLFDILGSAWDDLTSNATAPAQLPEPNSDTGISTPQATSNSYNPSWFKSGEAAIDGTGGFEGAMHPGGQGANPTIDYSTLGMRNNNPGNLRYNESVDWLGQTGKNKGFSTFDSLEHGVRAASKNLDAYNRRGWNSVNDVISHWAPPSENDTDSYSKEVADKLGVDPNDKLDLSEPNTKAQLLKAIFDKEVGAKHGIPLGVIKQGIASNGGDAANEMTAAPSILSAANPTQSPADKATSALQDIINSSIEDINKPKDWMDKLNNPVMAMGMALMGSKNPSFGGALSEGWTAYQANQKSQEDDKRQKLQDILGVFKAQQQAQEAPFDQRIKMAQLEYQKAKAAATGTTKGATGSAIMNGRLRAADMEAASQLAVLKQDPSDPKALREYQAILNKWGITPEMLGGAAPSSGLSAPPSPLDSKQLAISKAKDAIKNAAPRDAVIQRLKAAGFTDEELTAAGL